MTKPRRPASSNAVTTFGSLTRSELMSRVRSTGNVTTEARMVPLLRTFHLSGWRRQLALPGKPDFAWPSERVALFVDGCFWHGHGCGRNITPKTNAAFWQDKILCNKRRDHRVSRQLRQKGWTVLRVWECTLKRNPKRVVGRIRSALHRFAEKHSSSEN